jgi:hypothetical protein
VAIAWLVAAPAAAPAAPPNDDLASAQAIDSSAGLPVVTRGTNAGATAEVGEPAHDGTTVARNSVWFSWTPPASAAGTEVVIDTCGSSFPTALGVYLGSAHTSLEPVRVRGTATPADCGPGGQQGRLLHFWARGDETYRIAVDGRNGETGAFEVGISRAPRIAVRGGSVAEGPSGHEALLPFQVVLDRPVRWRMSGHYHLTSGYGAGHASAPADYDRVSGEITLPAGSSGTVVEARVHGDLEVEGDELVSLTATLGPPSLGTVHGPGTIVDDDQPAAAPTPIPHGCSPAGCPRPGFGPVRMHTSGDRSELVPSIPIRKRASPVPVMRIEPDELGELGAGDTLETSAEIEVSVTCVTPGTRCVGSRYRYDPQVAGRISIVDRASKDAGSVVLDRSRLRCSQSLPHRNHHCVLVFGIERTDVGADCETCALELALSARHGKAGPGDRLVIGSDSHEGVERDRGRLNASVIEADAPAPRVDVRRSPVRSSIPVANRKGSTPKRVLFSSRIGELGAFEQVSVEAKAYVRTSGLPYSTFLGSQLVLADDPKAVHSPAWVRDAALLQGEVTEKNGFNCTRGRSAHDNPCEIHKVGVVRMRRDADKRLYVNLVAEAGARWGGRYRRGDTARVLPEGWLRTERYDPLGWVEMSPLP